MRRRKTLLPDPRGTAASSPGIPWRWGGKQHLGGQGCQDVD